MIRPYPRWAIIAAVLALAVMTLFLYTSVMHRDRRLPYHDSFAQNKATEWTPIGGNWQLIDGAVVNRSDENGAKLVTGSSRWKDYQLDADVKLIGHDGDVGLIARVGDEERGADSYNGYYIGLRSPDSALVIGHADHGWMEGRPVAMLGGVQIGVWYHLTVVLFGCDIGAEATNLVSGQKTYAAFEEKLCVEQGKIGLRSMSTGGAWRNINAQAATPAALVAIRSRSSFLATPNYPTREDDYDNMREAYFSSTFLPARSYRVEPALHNHSSGVPPVSIEMVRTSESQTAEVKLQGVVTLTSPLYIQDDSGGIQVELSSPVALNLGDEVEVTGRTQERDGSPFLLASNLALRGDHTLVAPVSVTSTQAAGGAFDARLVELRGILKGKGTSGNQITLQMEDSEQMFRIMDSGNLSLKTYDALAPGSELRVRGICTIGPDNQPGADAFTILLGSMEDVEVLSGPPWWSPRMLPRYILLVLSLIAAGLYTYLRIERWNMRAILDERERIAYSMHDTLAQSFAGVGFQLQGVRNGLRSGTLKFHAAMEKLDIACNLATQTHREASAQISALHPEYTESSDILTALQRSTQFLLAGEFPRLELVRSGNPRKLSMTTRDALFQIGREAISNILRHAAASKITLKLIYEARQVALEICDNGRGFSYPEHAEDFGVRGMRHRAERAHGKLVVETSPGNGTCVKARMPCGSRFGFAKRLQLYRGSSGPRGR